MNQEQIKEARQLLLKAEINRLGLAKVAQLAQKPDRQINDMAAGRKSFGDKVAREIGPRIRPDLSSDWLLTPLVAKHSKPALIAAEPDATYCIINNGPISEVVEQMQRLSIDQQWEVNRAVKMLISSMSIDNQNSTRRAGK